MRLTEVPERLRRGAYRPWAELLKQTFRFDVLTCPMGSPRILAELRASGEAHKRLRQAICADRRIRLERSQRS